MDFLLGWNRIRRFLVRISRKKTNCNSSLGKSYWNIPQKQALNLETICFKMYFCDYNRGRIFRPLFITQIKWNLGCCNNYLCFYVKAIHTPVTECMGIIFHWIESNKLITGCVFKKSFNYFVWKKTGCSFLTHFFIGIDYMSSYSVQCPISFFFFLWIEISNFKLEFSFQLSQLFWIRAVKLKRFFFTTGQANQSEISALKCFINH